MCTCSENSTTLRGVRRMRSLSWAWEARQARALQGKVVPNERVLYYGTSSRCMELLHVIPLYCEIKEKFCARLFCFSHDAFLHALLGEE